MASVGVSDAATVRVEVDHAFGAPFSGYVFDVDIDADGTDDLRLRGMHASYVVSSSGGSSGGTEATGLNGTRIALGGPLVAGDLIDGTRSFGESQTMVGYRLWWSRFCPTWSECQTVSGTYRFGQWAVEEGSSVAGFLGLDLGGGRFGWVELDLRFKGGGTLRALGYESDAGAPIAAGAQTGESVERPPIPPVPLPGALVLLLGGLAALAVRRRV